MNATWLEIDAQHALHEGAAGVEVRGNDDKVIESAFHVLKTFVGRDSRRLIVGVPQNKDLLIFASKIDLSPIFRVDAVSGPDQSLSLVSDKRLGF
jgi:hypothetical protein